MTNETETAPRLYVGTYAKYNAGTIKGAWLALTDYDDREAFLQACRELHKDEADPELMFQDFENMPKALYNESACPDLWEILSECERHGLELETLAAFVDHGLGDWDDASRCADSFHGAFKDAEDFAEHLCNDCGTLDGMPDHLRPYFDMAAYARDLFMGDFAEVDDPTGGILVFSNH
jgi:antirestriction protein